MPVGEGGVPPGHRDSPEEKGLQVLTLGDPPGEIAEAPKAPSQYGQTPGKESKVASVPPS